MKKHLNKFAMGLLTLTQLAWAAPSDAVRATAVAILESSCMVVLFKGVNIRIRLG